MDKFTLEQDIVVCAVKAKSFPDGIMAAFGELSAKLPDPHSRGSFYGLSRPEDGEPVVYYAAAAEKEDGEAEQLGMKRIVIKKGEYIYRDISDYMQDLPAIGKTFMEMIHEPGLDPNGYCVELYTSQKDVRCMVRLA
jgi:predicted transcriptional regulator YdeE